MKGEDFMNKVELLNLLNELNLPKDEYYVLSGASLVLRGIREEAGDLDLCISEELFKEIKGKYELTEDKKNTCGFYRINDNLEVVVNKKELFKMEIGEEYNLEENPIEELTKIYVKKCTQRPKRY